MEGFEPIHDRGVLVLKASFSRGQDTWGRLNFKGGYDIFWRGYEHLLVSEISVE